VKLHLFAPHPPSSFSSVPSARADLQAPAPRTTNHGRPSADKLTVEAKTLADLKVEKAAVEGERRKVETDLRPVKYLATCWPPRTMKCSGISSS